MITKEKWAEIIKDFQEKGPPRLVERRLNIPKEVPIKRAISIIGPRRSGKTYSMFQIASELLKEKVEINRIVYINFERPDLSNCSSRDLQEMAETFYELYPENKKKKVWFFLDEIQNVEMWESFVRSEIDSGNVQIFISGSSSKLLSKEIATSLRGRTITYVMLPFSFSDFLNLKGIKPMGKYLSSSEKASIVNALRNYMETGGYPEVILYSQEKDKILLDILETAVYRDVVERYKVRNTKLLRLLMKSIISSEAREFSIHKFYNFAKSNGMSISKNSLYNYIAALSDVFLVFLLRKISGSYKEVEQTIPKVYVVDNGILSVSGINDYGRLMENMVFVELMRRGKNIFYHKSADGKEVDFVIVEKGKPRELLQVAYSLEDIAPREREVKAILKAGRELKCRNMKIITWEEEKLNLKNIKTIPLWKWLLEDA